MLVEDNIYSYRTKPEFNIFSLLIQNNSTFLTTSLRHRLSLKHLPFSRHGVRCFFLQILLEKKMTYVERTFFPVFLHFLPFSFSQKFGYFVFRYSREHFRHFLEFIHSRLATVARLPCLYLETGCDCILILGQYNCIPSIWYITASSKFGQCQPPGYEKINRGFRAN